MIDLVRLHITILNMFFHMTDISVYQECIFLINPSHFPSKKNANNKNNFVLTKLNYSPWKDNKREGRSHQTPQGGPQHSLHPRRVLQPPSR